MNGTVLAIIVMAVITALLRFLPFIALKNKKPPHAFDKLARDLPCAVMGMLVVYCLRGTSFANAAGFVPALAALAVIVASYVWKRNTLISIIGGTAVYMFLIQLVF